MITIDHLADPKNAAFVARLVPGVDASTILGARTPQLRAFAKTLWRARNEEARAFMAATPHRLFDENMLHGLLITQEKDFAACLAAVDDFLPYVDNWAVCDSMNPKALGTDLSALEAAARRWIDSDHLYTRRFGIGVLMEHFLTGAFKEEFLELVGGIDTEEYYLQMMIAWYFATAITKRPDDALAWLVEDRLAAPIRRKAIGKCIDSYRVSDETKDLLRSVRTTIPTLKRTQSRSNRGAPAQSE